MSQFDNIYPDSPAPIMKLQGASKPVLEFIFMLATTEPAETDPDWLQLRIIILFEGKNWRN